MTQQLEIERELQELEDLEASAAAVELPEPAPMANPFHAKDVRALDLVDIDDSVAPDIPNEPQPCFS